jgi:aminopeptidase YwaD
VPTHPERFIPDLRCLIGERHPDFSPGALTNTAEYLRQRFTALGLPVQSHKFDTRSGAYHNVIATRSPRLAPSKPPLILAAHYDTVAGSPGADDNASALAVMLEVVRQLSERPLQRSVQFIAFCLEEDNLLGSRAYAAELKRSGQAIEGAIVLECVGYARHEEGTQRMPPGIPVAVPTIGNFLAVIGNQQSQSLTQRVGDALAKHVPIVPLIVPGNGEALPDTRRSDHTAFWEQGFPAVMVTDTANFRNPHYHQPSDTIDTLDLAFMSSVAEGVTAAVLALAESADPS